MAPPTDRIRTATTGIQSIDTRGCGRSHRRRPALAMAVCALLALCAAGTGIPAHAQETTDWRERDTLSGDWGGARTRWNDAGVIFNAGYAAEVAGNLSGGDKRTARYTQQLELETLLDMERLAGIDDARVQITLNHRTGRSLSADVLHNQFSVQQLYTNAQILRLSQLNWLQHFDDGRLTVQLGWSPLGNDLARLDAFCKFQNVVICGHANAMTINSGAINGPVSQWGARIKYWPTDRFYINTGVYRNNPDGGTDDGFDLSLDNDGNFYPIELGWQRAPDRLEGLIAIGVYYNSATTPDVHTDIDDGPAGLTGQPFLQHGGRHGGYVMGRQVVYRPDPGNPDRGLSFGGIAGVGDSATARFRHFAIVGGLYRGPFASRPNDYAAFMVAWSPTNLRLMRYQQDRNRMVPGSVPVQHWETVIEVDYGIQATPWLLLQPNLQYIVQPGGNDDRSNALVLGLHMVIRL
ncbi:carbohydrate porin [Lysobacter sp. A289]